MMATTQDRLLVSIPQLKSERDWLMWKFQVTHALKAAAQWDHVTSTANTEEADYTRVKPFTQFCKVLVRSMCHGDELLNAESVVERVLSIL